MRALALALAAAVVFPTAVGAQQPKPQYTPEQLEQGLSQPPAAASDECAANGMATAPDGTCQPLVGAKRGFSLVRPKTPPAPEMPGARSRLITGGSRVIAAQPHGLDLQITFGNGSAVLTDQAKANSRVFAEVLNSPKFQGVRFAIDGHTNAVGGRDYNLKLSRDRAQAVVDFLTSQGVDASRFEVNGYGFDRPLDPADPRATTNRRVEARRLD